MTQTDDQQTYRVGILTDPRDEDPFVTGWDAAMKAVEERYRAFNSWDDLPIGVWLWEDDGARTTVEGIYYDGVMFTP